MSDVREDLGFVPAAAPAVPEGACSVCLLKPDDGVLHAKPGASPPVRDTCGRCIGDLNARRPARGRR